MQTAQITTPVANPAFEGLSRMSRHAPHLRPMAFEALMQMPLALLYDRSAPVDPIAADRVRMEPVAIRAPGDGIPDFANAVFTDARYAGQFFAERPLAFAQGMISEDLLSGVLETSGRHVAIDPYSDHTLYLRRKEVRTWLHAWLDAPPAFDPFERGDCECDEPTCHSQALLDRLDVLFASLRAVERAYLIRTRPLGAPVSSAGLTLVLDGYDAPSAERVRRALALLGLGLPQDEAPRKLLLLDRHPQFAHVARFFLTPIHDATAERWRAPV